MCGARLREIQNGEVWTSQCWPYIAGQYVSVQKIGTGRLSMCEVAVFARLGEYRKNLQPSSMLSNPESLTFGLI